MMTGAELAELVAGFFGPKATHVEVASDAPVVTFMLYEVFPARAGLDGEYGTFAGGVEYLKGQYLTTLLGQRLSLNDDVDSIRDNLRIIDEYCRARLPDKYLAALQH